MIAIFSTTTADTDMPIVLELLDPALYVGERRVSISKTLDLNVSFSDLGFTAADRRLTIKTIVTKTIAASLQSLLENNTELTIALWEGLFLVAPLSFRVSGNGTAVFTAAIKSKLSN